MSGEKVDPESIHEAVRLAIADPAGAPGDAARLGTDLRRHLDQCDECAAWVEDHRLLTAVAAAEPSVHPESELLARYAVEPDAVEEGEALWLDDHLASCRACRSELALVHQAVRAAREGDRAEPAAGRPAASPRVAVRWAIAAAAVVAVGLAFVLGGPDETEGDLVLSADRLEGRRVLEAERTITATETVVEHGAVVEFQAGESVVFGEGFSIANGAVVAVGVGRGGTEDDSEST